jgi:hypothetical protein
MASKPSTNSIECNGFKLTWTTVGENYRFAIMQGEHILAVASGSGHSTMIQPTQDNMLKALKRHFRDHNVKTSD